MNAAAVPSDVPVTITSSRRVAFVAHCLVNQNAKVQEFARSPGVVPGVVERLRRHGYRIQQLPCPEMAFAGVNRWWQGKELYDKANYRRHCRILAEDMAEPMAEFYRRGYEVVVIGLDGSPSSGVRYTGQAKDWGGRPAVRGRRLRGRRGHGRVDGGVEARARGARHSVAPRQRDVARHDRLGRGARPARAASTSSTSSSPAAGWRGSRMLRPDPRGSRVALLADAVANEGAGGFDALGALESAEFGVIILPPSDFVVSTIDRIVEYVVDDLADYPRNGYRIVAVGSSEVVQFGLWAEVLEAELERRGLTPFERFDVATQGEAAFDEFLAR